MAKTKVSNVLFQNSKLYLSISRGLFILNPPSGWGFDKPEVQLPTLPPICPVRGVVGLVIDRCIIRTPVTFTIMNVKEREREREKEGDLTHNSLKGKGSKHY